MLIWEGRRGCWGAYYEEWRVNNKQCHQKSSVSTGSQKLLGDRSYRNQGESKEGCLPYNHTAKSSTETVQQNTTTHT